MARCEKCNACQFMYDVGACKHCGHVPTDREVFTWPSFQLPETGKNGDIFLVNGRCFRFVDNHWVEDKNHKDELCGQEGTMIIQDEFNNGNK